MEYRTARSIKRGGGKDKKDKVNAVEGEWTGPGVRSGQMKEFLKLVVLIWLVQLLCWITIIGGIAIWYAYFYKPPYMGMLA